MPIDYKFNEWRVAEGEGNKVEEEEAERWNHDMHDLISLQINKYCSGYEIGGALYLYHVKGYSSKEINKHPMTKLLHHSTIKKLIKGDVENYENPVVLQAYYLFFKVLNNDPAVLDSAYKEV